MNMPNASRTFDRENTLRRVDGDIGLLQRLYRHFLDERPKLSRALSDALEKGDFEALQDAAHSLKGASIAIGAEAVGETLLSLETSARTKDADGARRNLKRLDRELELFDREMQKVLQE